MLRISALIVGLSLVGGCSKTSPDTAPPDSPEASDPRDDDNSQLAATASARFALHSPTASGVYIDPTLATVCELSSADDFFVYDADAADIRADRILEAVAICFKDGPMTGRRLELVTHDADADAGSLVAFRTEELRGALMRGGVAREDILTAARTGDAEMPQGAEGWPNERRVDIRVVARRSH